MRKIKIISIITFITIILLFIMNPMIEATINPNDYGVTVTPGEVAPLTNLAKPIINVLAVIGTVVLVITLIVIGIKYMTGSVDEKAEYKKTIIPYLIGAFMIFGITQFLNVLVKMVESLE